MVSVNADINQVLVKFVDYESSSEQELRVDVDTETVYEGVKSIYEIKPLDTVSIDYIVTVEGKNIARNLSVEVVDSQEDSEVSLPL